MAAAAAAGIVEAAGEDVATGSPIGSLADRMRELIGSHGEAEGWDKCWEAGVTPWDLGQPTPALLKLVNSATLPMGHDVVALSSPDRSVVGLDMSDTAVHKAKERTSSSPNGNMFEFVKADFFAWEPAPARLFDLIYDYTFFCAVDPSLRPAWGRRIGELLKPDGELVTLMYLAECQGGPPFTTTVVDYEKVLNPLGFVVTSLEENELAVASRKGKEKVGRWKRITK